MKNKLLNKVIIEKINIENPDKMSPHIFVFIINNILSHNNLLSNEEKRKIQSKK